MNKIFNNNPYIILGVHRSGTSLMSRIFDKTGIFMGINQNINSEADFFFKINKNLLKETNSNAYFFENSLKAFENKNFITEKTVFLKKHINKKIKFKFFGLKNYLKYAFENKKIKWGFKDPRTIIFFPIWAKIFPDAKFLIIFRNPIDVCMSIYYFEQKRWKQKLKKRPDLKFEMPLEKTFEVWKNFTEILIKLSEKENPNIISVKYEELRNTEVLKKIIKFTNSEINIEEISGMIKINPSNYKKPEGYDNLIELISKDELTKKLYPDLKF